MYYRFCSLPLTLSLPPSVFIILLPLSPQHAEKALLLQDQKQEMRDFAMKKSLAKLKLDEQKSIGYVT